MAQLIKEWVTSCQQCTKEKRLIANSPVYPCKAPVDTQQHIRTPCKNDSVPEVPPPGGYEDLVTAMDVFSRLIFPYPTSNHDAKTIATIKFTIMTKQSFNDQVSNDNNHFGRKISLYF